MSLLPPPGPKRTRLVALLSLLGVALVVLVWRGPLWGGATSNGGAPPAAPPVPTGLQSRAGSQAKPAQGAAMPVPVNLDKLEPVPDEPTAARNLFRFGAPPPPPPPPPTKAVEQKPIVVEAPKPVYPPPIDLQLKGITQATAQTPAIAWLKDPKAPDSRILPGSEGQIVDGKYKVVKVGKESVIVSYVDGTGLKTILLPR